MHACLMERQVRALMGSFMHCWGGTVNRQAKVAHLEVGQPCTWPIHEGLGLYHPVWS